MGEVGVKERVEAAKKALGYGAKVWEWDGYVEVWQSLYWCTEECGGVGCRKEVSVHVSRRNGAIKVYVNGFDRESLNKLTLKHDDPCLNCHLNTLEWVHSQINQNL